MRTYEIHTETRQAQPTAVASARLAVEQIGPWLSATYPTVASVIATGGAAPAGPPFARYRKLDDNRFDVEAGFPVRTVIEPRGAVRSSSLPAGPVATTMHAGAYDTMEPAYAALTSWIGAHGGKVAGDPWEVYLSNPAEEPDPGAWRTQVVQPYLTPTANGEQATPRVVDRA